MHWTIYNIENKYLRKENIFTWARLRLVSMEIGTKNGITFVASISRGKPPDFVDDIATFIIPNIAIRTAGSRDGMDWSKGITSSIIIHLSKDSTNFPRHIKQLTRTWKNKKWIKKNI